MRILSFEFHKCLFSSTCVPGLVLYAEGLAIKIYVAPAFRELLGYNKR